MNTLWTPEIEKRFFRESLDDFASPEQLFYKTEDKRNLAYWEKRYKGKKSTLQSRNSLIGKFTEKWSKDLLQSAVESEGYFAVQGAVCPEIALSKQSSADVVIARKNQVDLKPEDILVIFEVKMSVVWNWELRKNELLCIGDYTTHQGNPGLLRSDSMLKAIGKSINIRVSDYKAAPIPIIVLGNTPITQSYIKKVDHLKTAGIIQGFWSINPRPIDSDKNYVKKTQNQGFVQFQQYDSFKQSLSDLLSVKLNFFSSMKSKLGLGKIIEVADEETTYERKAEIFLKLLREE